MQKILCKVAITYFIHYKRVHPPSSPNQVVDSAQHFSTSLPQIISLVGCKISRRNKKNGQVSISVIFFNVFPLSHWGSLVICVPRCGNLSPTAKLEKFQLMVEDGSQVISTVKVGLEIQMLRNSDFNNIRYSLYNHN